MATVIVSGAIANKCFNGGAAWTRLSWILGFRKLGFKVFFLEQIGKESCLDPEGEPLAFRDSVNLAYFREVTKNFGLAGSAALIHGELEDVYGATSRQLLELAEAADLLVNISGHLTVEPLFRRIRRRIYVDLDPGFTQFWHAQGLPGTHLEGHHHFFTIGENIGTCDCPIPSDGIPWQAVRQPVVLDQWPVCSSAEPNRFTTVAAWRGPYGPVQQGDNIYGLKVHEFRKFMKLPELATGTDFEIALDIHPGDQEDLCRLRGHGWRIEDPLRRARGPGGFQEYVQGSGAEFSVAQGIYTETRSGWFSDRTVRYLASGKPALVQETGFSRHLPVGEGLLSFSTLDEALEGIQTIGRDYPMQARAARALAEEYFDSTRVLGGLLEKIGISASMSSLSL